MAELSRECERIARGWLVETQGNPETALLRHAIWLLLEKAEAEVERVRNHFHIPSSEVTAVPCEKCGGPVIEFTIPSEIWNLIVRRGGPEGDCEYLCYICWMVTVETEVKRLREELQSASECLGMICSRLDSFGVPMEATPPMNYDDAISGLLFRRLKEAGVFPGHPATVRYEVHDREGDDDWFRRVPLEAAEAKGGHDVT